MKQGQPKFFRPFSSYVLLPLSKRHPSNTHKMFLLDIDQTLARFSVKMTHHWWLVKIVRSQNRNMFSPPNAEFSLVNPTWWKVENSHLKPSQEFFGGLSLGCFEGASFGSLTSPGSPQSATKWNLVDGTCIDCGWLLLMEEIRRSPVEVGSLSHHLQGFIHPRWCRFLPSTVCPALVCKVAIFEPRTKKKGFTFQWNTGCFFHDGIIIISYNII